jgi:hypothetical protein
MAERKSLGLQAQLLAAAPMSNQTVDHDAIRFG